MMKNKEKLKKVLIILMFYLGLLIILTVFINKYEYETYKDNFDKKLNAIILEVQEKYPLLSEEEILKILSSTDGDGSALSKYSLTINNESLVRINDQKYQEYLVINVTLITISTGGLIIIFLLYNHHKDKEIKKITKYLEAINKRNYQLDIDDMSEDELSILKNELYKITVKLKEDAENSKKAKLELKDTLADITHQLKTPITSILIILDNIIDNPNMDAKTKEEFIRDIKRELINMNFLTLSLLKLSKLDANTVHFFNKKVLLAEIVEGSMEKLESLCDLKNITIETNLASGALIYCDLSWQIEAVTNILKNCIEHSKEGSKVSIKSMSNKVYASLEIRDYGEGISDKDLPHIFERFYKGESSLSDSIGIGLSLAKKIIESNNGLINVETSNKGTKFVIKYFY